jgi:hypothetical protein
VFFDEFLFSFEFREFEIAEVDGFVIVFGVLEHDSFGEGVGEIDEI